MEKLESGTPNKTRGRAPRVSDIPFCDLLTLNFLNDVQYNFAMQISQS